MSDAPGEVTEQAGEQPPPRTAGAILREARQAQGLHIAALAATIKVAQKKLEALEADRLDELPDATFTRALAQTVCRALKIDATPVLALLPAPAGHRLEHVGEGINEPFRDRPGRHEPSDWSFLGSPAVWGPLLIVIGAAALYLLPSGWLASLQLLSTVSAPAPTASAVAAQPKGTASEAVSLFPPVAEPASAPPAVTVAPPAVTTPAPAPAPVKPAASAVASGAAARGLRVHTSAASWVEVHDARSRVLIARLVQAGETIDVDGEAPLRLKIGNARAAEVVFRGQPQDLSASTRENVARIELK
jgi:cytoskeleton protein RodZ